MAKKPFKLQNILKLNNRIIEQDLRLVAAKAMQVLLEIKDPVLQLKLNDVLQDLTLAGSKSCDVVGMQAGLTHTSSQEDLEAFFKLVTSPLAARRAEMKQRAQETLKGMGKSKPKDDDTCECPVCQLRRSVSNFADSLVKKSTKNDKPKETKQETSVKMYEIKVPKGVDPTEAINEIVANLVKKERQ